MHLFRNKKSKTKSYYCVAESETYVKWKFHDDSDSTKRDGCIQASIDKNHNVVQIDLRINDVKTERADQYGYVRKAIYPEDVSFNSDHSAMFLRHNMHLNSGLNNQNPITVLYTPEEGKAMQTQLAELEANKKKQKQVQDDEILANNLMHNQRRNQQRTQDIAHTDERLIRSTNNKHKLKVEKQTADDHKMAIDFQYQDELEDMTEAQLQDYIKKHKGVLKNTQVVASGVAGPQLVEWVDDAMPWRIVLEAQVHAYKTDLEIYSLPIWYADKKQLVFMAQDITSSITRTDTVKREEEWTLTFHNDVHDIGKMLERMFRYRQKLFQMKRPASIESLKSKKISVKGPDAYHEYAWDLVVIKEGPEMLKITLNDENTHDALVIQFNSAHLHTNDFGMQEVYLAHKKAQRGGMIGYDVQYDNADDTVLFWRFVEQRIYTDIVAQVTNHYAQTDYDNDYYDYDALEYNDGYYKDEYYDDFNALEYNDVVEEYPYDMIRRDIDEPYNGYKNPDSMYIYLGVMVGVILMVIVCCICFVLGLCVGYAFVSVKKEGEYVSGKDPVDIKDESDIHLGAH